MLRIFLNICRNFRPISDLMFNIFGCLFLKIVIFSNVHIPQICPGLTGFLLPTIDLEMGGSVPKLCSHINSDSAVFFFLLS